MKIDRRVYLDSLDKLMEIMRATENSVTVMRAKVLVLAIMNLRYEKVAFNKELSEHPFELTKQIIDDAICQYNAFIDLLEFEGDKENVEDLGYKSNILEEKHQELWQEIWSRHNQEEFQEFVDMKYNRLVINDLIKYVKDSNCVDFGAGNGSFAFALLQAGASSIQGIDFGTKQVRYATKVAESLNLSNKAVFKEAEVFDTGLKSDSYEFAVSNGVFHHLSEYNMEKSVAEVARVMKDGGWFWYYIDGIDAISMDLWDDSVETLKDIPILFIEEVLKTLNLKRNKMVHVMDGLSATYKHSSWSEATAMLSKYGFTNFKRLTGGESTDFDLDVVESDKYGKEKFGEGDLRILCQIKKV